MKILEKFIKMQTLYRYSKSILKIFGNFPYFEQLFAFYERNVISVRCLKSNEDMILALAGQFKQLTFCGSYLHLISNTALHITFLSYDIPSGKPA